MLQVSTHITGPENRLVRRTIARWLKATAVLAWRGLSIRIRKRFPTEEHIVRAGLFTEKEYQIYKDTDGTQGKWFLPILWCANIIKLCHERRIIDSVQMKILMEKLWSYRGGFGGLMAYDWVKMPLVYVQVAAIATYGYFAVCLIGRQYTKADAVRMYIPIFTILQFIFYLGWLKVGQALMNPLGEDEDDFEMNYILDRNLQVGFLIADLQEVPELVSDSFEETKPVLPHTKASAKRKDKLPRGKFKRFHLNDADQEIINSDNTTAIDISASETRRCSIL